MTPSRLLLRECARRRHRVKSQLTRKTAYSRHCMPLRGCDRLNHYLVVSCRLFLVSARKSVCGPKKQMVLDAWRGSRSTILRQRLWR